MQQMAVGESCKSEAEWLSVVTLSGEDSCLGRGLRLTAPHKNPRHKSKHRTGAVSHRGDAEDRVPTHGPVRLAGKPVIGTDPGTGHDPVKVQTEKIGLQLQLVQFSEAFSVSEALRSSLMTADKASGLMPCSHSLTHMDRDSMSKPVFSNLEISSSTSIVSRTAFKFAFAALAMV